jgi:hypothetical protein
MSEHREPITSPGTTAEHSFSEVSSEAFSEYRNIRRRRISRHPGRIEQVLASIALFVLKLMRPKLPPDHVRLDWFCVCGPDPGPVAAIQEDSADFQKDLGILVGDVGKRQPSFAHIIGFESRLTLLFITNLPWFVALFMFFSNLWLSTPNVVQLLDNVHEQKLHYAELITIAIELCIALYSAILLGELPII